jgi:hypothetical protein
MTSARARARRYGVARRKASLKRRAIGYAPEVAPLAFLSSWVCSASRNVDGVSLVWFVRHAASAQTSKVSPAHGNAVNDMALVTRSAAMDDAVKRRVNRQ